MTRRAWKIWIASCCLLAAVPVVAARIYSGSLERQAQEYISRSPNAEPGELAAFVSAALYADAAAICISVIALVGAVVGVVRYRRLSGSVEPRAGQNGHVD